MVGAPRCIRGPSFTITVLIILAQSTFFFTHGRTNTVLVATGETALSVSPKTRFQSATIEQKPKNKTIKISK